MIKRGRPTKTQADERDKATRQMAEHELIRRGQLRWLLHKGQKELYDSFKGSDHKITVWNCARRFGKSFVLLVIAFEECMRNPGRNVRFAAPTQRQIKTYFQPLFDTLISRFPKDAIPTHSEGVWTFTNGSKLHIAGADYKDGDALRGQASDLILADEAGFVKKLTYLITDILMPQLLTTRGRLIMASTPPKSVAHPFCDYIGKAIRDGSYQKRTIYDNPMLTKKDIADVINQSGGKESDSFRREYMGELISDSSSRIIPEFDVKRHVRPAKPPGHYFPLVSMDWGAHDMTAIIFGYIDFHRQVLVIQDEIVVNNSLTKDIAEKVHAKEAELWKGRPEAERIGDNPLQIIWDLSGTYKLRIRPPLKYDKDVAIANLRDMFVKHKIEIDPRCTSLIFQLENGVWNDNRTSFERSDTLGHCDAIDALIYQARHSDFRRNPFPKEQPVVFNTFIPNSSPETEDAFKKIFNLKR